LEDRYVETAEDCVRGAVAAVVMTAWAEFKRLKPDDFARLMRSPVLSTPEGSVTQRSVTSQRSTIRPWREAAASRRVIS